MKKTFTILTIGSGLALSQAQAEIESEFHVGYNSKYVFRGLDSGSDAYEYGLEFAGACDCGLDWSAGIWGISPDGEGSGINNDELDIYATVSKDFGSFAANAGFIAYTYPNGGAPDDADVFVGVSGEAYGLKGSLTAFFGTDGQFQEQILIEGKVSYTHKVSDTVELKAAYKIGYIVDDGQGVYANDEGMAYYSATLSADIALSDDITLSPYVSYVDGNGSTINYADSAIEDGVIGGAKLTFSF